MMTKSTHPLNNQIIIYQTKDGQAKVEQLQKETGMFVNLKIGELHEDEYPE